MQPQMQPGDMAKMIELWLTQGGVLMVEQIKKSFLETREEHTHWSIPALIAYCDTILDSVDPTGALRSKQEDLLAEVEEQS